jgi:antirestriction protein ArdC
VAARSARQQPGDALDRVRNHGWIAISSIGSARDYAAEELVAELGAAFLRAEFGFDGDVRRLHRDLDRPVEVGQRAFFAACSKVSKAADYLRDLALAEPFRTWSRVNRISVMPITARKQRLL